MPTLSLLTLLAFIFSFQQFTLIYADHRRRAGAVYVDDRHLHLQHGFPVLQLQLRRRHGRRRPVPGGDRTIIFVVVERRVIRDPLLAGGTGVSGSWVSPPAAQRRSSCCDGGHDERGHDDRGGLLLSAPE